MSLFEIGTAAVNDAVLIDAEQNNSRAWCTLLAAVHTCVPGTYLRYYLLYCYL